MIHLQNTADPVVGIVAILAHGIGGLQVVARVLAGVRRCRRGNWLQLPVTPL